MFEKQNDLNPFSIQIDLSDYLFFYYQVENNLNPFSIQTSLECFIMLSYVQNEFATVSVLLQFHWMLP